MPKSFLTSDHLPNGAPSLSSTRLLCLFFAHKCHGLECSALPRHRHWDICCILGTAWHLWPMKIGMEGKLWRITVQDPNTLGLKQQELKPKRWVSVQRTQICPKPLGFPPSIRGYNDDHWIPNSSCPFLLASAPRLTCRMQAMPGADGASSCKSTTPFRWTWKLQQRRRLPGQRWNDVLGVAGWILHRNLHISAR